MVAGGVSGENLMTILRLPDLNESMTHDNDGNVATTSVLEPKKRRNWYLSWEVIGSYDEHS